MIVGIDPGIHGAAAALCERRGMLAVIDLPTHQVGKRLEIDSYALLRWLRIVRPHRIVIENVHSMPKEGVVSAFRFGVAVGMIKAMCHVVVQASDLELVEAAVWKEYFDLVGCDKEASRQLALTLFPMHAAVLARKKDHQRAEGMLIAKWGARPIIGRNW
jgi:crossover junction endodeoxyribonuclease RuvC